MILRLKRTPGIYLVGFMGSGKSTIGRKLADELGWKFVDLDERIEQANGMTIKTLFESRGEEEFRRVEKRELQKLVGRVEAGQPHVIALGGGAFVQPGVAEWLSTNGISIYLDAPIGVLKSRVAGHTHRPLARDLKKFESLHEARRPHYERADYRVVVGNNDPMVAVNSILALHLFG